MKEMVSAWLHIVVAALLAMSIAPPASSFSVTSKFDFVEFTHASKSFPGRLEEMLGIEQRFEGIGNDGDGNVPRFRAMRARDVVFLTKRCEKPDDIEHSEPWVSSFGIRVPSVQEVYEECLGSSKASVMELAKEGDVEVLTIPDVYGDVKIKYVLRAALYCAR